MGYSVGRLFTQKPRLAAIRHISRIGLPISTQQLAFVVVYWFLIGFVHEFGETAGAAMGIGNRMESFSYLTCYGFSLAASTMVGQNLGAGQPDRAARCAWGATGLGIALTLIFSIFFLSIPDVIASVFTDNPIVLEIAVGYLIILGLSQFTMAVEIILEGAFSGAGDTVPPMVVMLPGSIARIPLAWYLAFELDWGIEGIWWTLTITTTFKAVVLAWWFRLGRWKEKKV
jgi:putative MATE family efflux protein